MAENLSVYKTISTIIAPFGSNKNVVIRATIASLVDSVIVRYCFYYFMVFVHYRGDACHTDG